MSEFRVLVFTAAVAGLALAAPAAQAATTLKLGPSALCSASGCFADTKRTFTYSFSASEFGGGANVSQLSIFKGLLGDMATYGVKITFQTADGTVVGDWGTFTLAALAGETVTIGGKTIDWNSAAGDLVVKLELLIPDKGGAGGGFGGGFGGGGFAAAPIGAGDLIPRAPSLLAPPTGGLVADLRAAVPEPSTWAMMIMGFGAAGAVLRRRRFALKYG